MSIRDVVTGLVSVQSQLAISTPASVKIRHAYAFPPNRKADLETPCWINGWDLTRVERRLTGGVTRQFYTVTTQLFCYDADLFRAADIASAFLDPYVVALNNNITLNGSCKQSDLRGGNPTLAMLEWNGKGYPGLHLLVDVFFDEGIGFA